MDVGDSLIMAISSALHKSDFVVAVISENSIDSKWVQKELSYAMADEIEGESIRVLPVVITRCMVPHYLRDKLYADFEKNGFDEAGALVLRSIARREKRQSEIKNNGISFASVKTVEEVGDVISIEREIHDLDLHAKSSRSLGYYFLLSLLISLPLLLLSAIKSWETLTPIFLWLFVVGLWCGYLFVASSHFINSVMNEDKNIVVGFDALGFGLPFSQKWISAWRQFGYNNNFRWHMVYETLAVASFFLSLAYLVFRILFGME